MPRAASRSRPIVVWQDKRSQEVLDRLADREEEVQAATGLPFDPYFSAAKLAWLLEHDDAVGRARDAGTLRMGTVDSFLCDRLGAGFATDASTASRTQLHSARDARLRPGDVRALRRAARGAARGAGHRRRARHPPPPQLAGGAGADRADRGPAGRAGGRRVRGARPREGHLRHRRVRARPRGRRDPAGGGRPAAHGGVEHRRARGVRAGRRRVRGRRHARVAVPRDGRGRRTRPRSARWRARRRTRPARWCCPRWRASARRGGGRRRAP